MKETQIFSKTSATVQYSHSTLIQTWLKKNFEDSFRITYNIYSSFLLSATVALRFHSCVWFQRQAAFLQPVSYFYNIQLVVFMWQQYHMLDVKQLFISMKLKLILTIKKRDPRTHSFTPSLNLKMCNYFPRTEPWFERPNTLSLAIGWVILKFEIVTLEFLHLV